MSVRDADIPGEDRVTAEAARWHVASLSEDMDWDGFTQWLEAAPEHGERYREIALADAELDARRDAVRQIVAGLDGRTVAPPRAETDHLESEFSNNLLNLNRFSSGNRSPLFAKRSAVGRWAWGGAAAAAVAVMALTLPMMLRQSSIAYATEAAPRTIAFADGSSVELAPHSRMVVDGERPRRVELSGGAWFSIRHDPQRSLEIVAGPVTIRDIGTSFDVQADGSQVRVGVAEGQLTVASSVLGKPVALERGKAFLYDGDARVAQTQEVDPTFSGGWRFGELRYRQTPLSLVANDLHRYAGVELIVPVDLRNRPFSGILSIKNAQRATRDLALLMGLTLVHGPNGDRLSASGR